MTFAVGEVREFATGFMVAVAADGFSPGSFTAKMQTVQKLWNGEAWVEVNDPAAGDVMHGIYEARR